MSTEGDGKACQLATALGLSAASGAGIIIDKGMMWLGEKIWQNCKDEEERWAAHYNAMDANSKRQMETMRGFILVQIDKETMQSSDDDSGKASDQKALLEALAQARNAINDASNIARAKADTERKMLITQLSDEIDAARGILPDDVLWRAGIVLNGSNAAMQEALRDLEKAWNSKAKLLLYQERQRHKAEQMLESIARQLTIIMEMAKDASEVDQNAFSEQRKAIKKLCDAAALKRDPEEALLHATEARKATRALAEDVALRGLEAWESVQSDLNALRGTANALEKMTQEASSIKMATQQQASHLTKRIATLYNEIEAVADSEPGTVRQRILLLRERAELLKQDVFTIVQRNQQRSIAETIANTLEELGFHSIEGGASKVKVNGDLLRVETVHSTDSSVIGRDDKVVSFDISRQGEITYDFGGYVGDACLAEAERIFAALREKGLYILDRDAARRLQNSSVKRITAEMLLQKEFQLELEANKVQAKLAERLREVLKQMNYAGVIQNVVGGCIELEAFNGAIGYRVILMPEGSAQVFKDKAYVDVSADAHDPIVAEALDVLKQEEKANPAFHSQFQQSQQRRGKPYIERSKQQLQES